MTRLVSFCMTCKNRKPQLEKTLRTNLLDNVADRRRVEFVLVDFDTPGLREWIAASFQDELADGYLRYYHSSALPYWHASVAKNTSHRVSTGKIVVNLDCDNFTGRHGGRFLMHVFEKFGYDAIFHQRNPDTAEPNWGRIAMSRESFDALGGYAENMMPAGGQDHDLLAKFRARWPKRAFIYTATQREQSRYDRHAGAGRRDTSSNGSSSSSSSPSSSEVVTVRRQGRRIFIKYPASGAPRFVAHSMETKLRNIAPEWMEKQQEKGWSPYQLWQWMNVENINWSTRSIRNRELRNNSQQQHIGTMVSEPLRVRAVSLAGGHPQGQAQGPPAPASPRARENQGDAASTPLVPAAPIPAPAHSPRRERKERKRESRKKGGHKRHRSARKAASSRATPGLPLVAMRAVPSLSSSSSSSSGSESSSSFVPVARIRRRARKEGKVPLPTTHHPKAPRASAPNAAERKRSEKSKKNKRSGKSAAIASAAAPAATAPAVAGRKKRARPSATKKRVSEKKNAAAGAKKHKGEVARDKAAAR